MIAITKYEDTCVNFYCNVCQKDSKLDISSLVSDNCAVVIDVTCPDCNDSKDLYILVNKDPIKALELQAKMDFLKVNRAARVGYGNQIDESERDSTTKIS
jgi:rubredoxin